MSRNEKPPGPRPKLPCSAAPPPKKYYPGQLEAERLELEKEKEKKEKDEDFSWWWLLFLG